MLLWGNRVPQSFSDEFLREFVHEEFDRATTSILWDVCFLHSDSTHIICYDA